MLGKPNGSNKIRLLTLADVDDPKKIEFDAPTKSNGGLSPGAPKWANYIKGVIQHFPRMKLKDSC
jgi:galactokinase